MNRTTENPRHTGSGHRKSNRFRMILTLLAVVATPLVTRYLDAGIVAPTLGALGIVILYVSGTLKLSIGVAVSLISTLLMFMLYLWHWADSYFISIYVGNLQKNWSLFRCGVIETLAVVFLWWTYKNQIKRLKMRVNQEWFVRKSLLRFLRGMIFLPVFLLILWITGYLLYEIRQGTRYHEHDIAIWSAVIAAVVTGGIYIAYRARRNSPGNQHKHHRHHRSVESSD